MNFKGPTCLELWSAVRLVLPALTPFLVLSFPPRLGHRRLGADPGLFAAGHIVQGLATSLMLIAAVPPLVVGWEVRRLRPTAVTMNLAIFGAVALQNRRRQARRRDRNRGLGGHRDRHPRRPLGRDGLPLRPSPPAAARPRGVAGR